jgi:hypothetical protein
VMRRLLGDPFMTKSACNMIANVGAGGGTHHTMAVELDADARYGYPKEWEGQGVARTAYILKLGRILRGAVDVLHNSNKLPLLGVAHGENPVGVGLCGAAVQAVPVIHVVVAVVGYEGPVSAPVAILGGRDSGAGGRAGGGGGGSSRPPRGTWVHRKVPWPGLSTHPVIVVQHGFTGPCAVRSLARATNHVQVQPAARLVCRRALGRAEQGSVRWH